MFVDYIPLLLINMSAGLLILAYYIFSLPEIEHKNKWAPSFFIVSLVALVGGFHMCFNWPLPGSFNVAYGELSVLIGALFLGASIILAKDGNPLPLGIYAALAGMASVIVGLRILELGLTNEPIISAIGFIMTGTCGIFLPLVIYFTHNRILRIGIIVILILSAVIWARIGYKAYWNHLKYFKSWPGQVATKQGNFEDNK